MKRGESEVESILLVSSAPKSAETLSLWLCSMGLKPVVATSGGAARRTLTDTIFQAVIVHCPLSDEFGHLLSTEIASKSPTGVIMIVKNDMTERVTAQVENYGVCVLPSSLNQQLLYQAVKMAKAASVRLAGLYREKDSLQKKVEEIRLVSRAKGILMEYEQYTEPDAHRHIEKCAMDQRKTRLQIAKSIIKKYEISQGGSFNE